MSVAADPKLTTRADCALTSVCRVPVVVNSDWLNPPKLIKFESAVTKGGKEPKNGLNYARK